LARVWDYGELKYTVDLRTDYPSNLYILNPFT
jgi:hypothetical protein